MQIIFNITNTVLIIEFFWLMVFKYWFCLIRSIWYWLYSMTHTLHSVAKSHGMTKESIKNLFVELDPSIICLDDCHRHRQNIKKLHYKFSNIHFETVLVEFIFTKIPTEHNSHIGSIWIHFCRFLFAVTLFIATFSKSN